MHSILHYLTKYGFKGSQLLHALKAGWGRFKQNWENVIYWPALKKNLRHNWKILTVFEKHKKWPVKWSVVVNQLSLKCRDPTKRQN